MGTLYGRRQPTTPVTSEKLQHDRKPARDIVPRNVEWVTWSSESDPRIWNDWILEEANSGKLTGGAWSEISPARMGLEPPERHIQGREPDNT